MPVLSDRDIADLVTGTLDRLKPVGFGMIANRLQRYTAMKDILKKEKVQFGGGTGVQRRIMVDHSGAAKQVGLYQQDAYNVDDVLQKITADWRHTTVPYAWERREMLMNRGEERLTNLLTVRRTDAMVSLAELLESQFWSKPTDSNDKLNVWGVPYWIVSNATLGFNGGNATGFSSGPGGLNSSTYERWKNFTGRYVNVSKTDLVRKMREGSVKTDFRPPVDFPDIRRGSSRRHRIFTNYSVISEIEEILEGQNDKLGFKVNPADGRAMFNSTPFEYVPKLDSFSNNPIYTLDMNTIFAICLRGDFLRESGPEKMANAHNVWKVDIDMTWNVMCVDRRSNAVYDTAG